MSSTQHEIELLLQDALSRLTASLAAKLPSSSSSHWIAPPNAPAPTAADVPPWILDPSIAHPLHASYDARISELLETVRSLEGNARGDSSVQFSQRHQHARALSSADSAAEAAQLESASLREEVVQLRRICAELTQVVEERDVAAEAQLTQHRALTSSLQQVHSALKRLDTEKKAVDSALSETQSSLILLRSEHSETMKALREAAQEAESRELQLKSYRSAIEEVAARAGAEAEALALKAKTANEKKRELQEANETLAADLAAAKTELESTRNELYTTRADAENMLLAIQASESQLGAIESREAKARAIELAAAEKEANAQRLVDIAVAGEEDAKRDLARLLEKRRIELESHQAQEAEAIAAARSRLVEAASVREEEILRLRQDSASAQATAERYQRETSSAQSELARAEALAASEQRRLSESIRLLSERVARAEEDKDAASHMAIQGEALALERMRDAEAARAEAEQRSLAAEAGIRRVSSALQSVESRNRELSDQVLDVERALDAQRRETLSFKMRAETAEVDLVNEKGRIQRQLQLSMQQSHQGSESWTGSSSALANSSGSSAGAVARQVQERAYVDEINRLRSKIREMSSLLIALQRDHAAAVNAANEAEESLAVSRDACAQAEANATDLLSQISSAAVREDSLLRSLEDLRTQSELSKLKASRANARAESLAKKLEAAEAESVRMSLVSTGRRGVLSTSYRQSSADFPIKSSLVPITSKRSHISASVSRHSQSAVQATGAHSRSYFGSRQTKLEDDELVEKLAQLGIPPHVSDLYEEHANDSAHVQTSDDVRVSRPPVNPILLPQQVPVIVKAVAAQEALRDVTKAVSVAKGNEEQVFLQALTLEIKQIPFSASDNALPAPRSEAAQEAEFKELQLKSHRMEEVAAQAGAEVEALALKAKTENDKKEGELVLSQTFLLAKSDVVPQPAPPALVSSSLLLSPRLSDASGGLHEGAEEEEARGKQPTHDLDISFAALEATVENLQPSASSDQESSTLASPLEKVAQAPSSGSLDKVNKMSNEEVVGESESPTPVSRLEDREIQNIALSISPAEPDKPEGLVDDAASPLFETDEDSSVDASPEPVVRREVRIEQPHSALSPGAALSSVSLSSPDFVLEDEEEGGVDDYYGEQDSDSFDNDDTEDVDQFGDNHNLQEEEDDLEIEDAF